MNRLTLGIETSCDETSAAVLRGMRDLRSCVIATQIPIHQKYGGVVPEIASRNHILSILPVIEQALHEADAALADVDQIAVTYGPGLVGALLVGKGTFFFSRCAAHRGQSSRGTYLCELPRGQGTRAALHGSCRLRRAHGARRCRGL